MTPDQVWCRLCDEKVLKTKGGRRTSSAVPAAIKPDSGGFVKGRDKDGNLIKARIGVEGKSLARRLMEQQKTEKGK